MAGMRGAQIIREIKLKKKIEVRNRMEGITRRKGTGSGRSDGVGC
jgi:hypothetical protein